MDVLELVRLKTGGYPVPKSGCLKSPTVIMLGVWNTSGEPLIHEPCWKATEGGCSFIQYGSKERQQKARLAQSARCEKSAGQKKKCFPQTAFHLGLC